MVTRVPGAGGARSRSRPGRRIEPATLSAIRASLLREMLDRMPAPSRRASRAADDGRPRDLTRPRVLRLPPPAFAEYVDVTGRHYAAATAAPARATGPGRDAPALPRLPVRGPSPRAAPRLRRAAVGPALRLRHLAHLPRALPPRPRPSTGARSEGVRLDLADPEVRRLLRHAVASIADGVGTARRPVVDEVAVGASSLASACALAAMEARREGKDRVDAPLLVRGLTGAAILGHADSGALFALVTTLAGGVDALALVEDLLRAGRQGAGDAAREVERVQERHVHGPALGAVLGPESEEHDAAAAQRRLHERRLAVQLLVAQQPPRQQRVRRPGSARRPARPHVEGGAVLEPDRARGVEPVARADAPVSTSTASSEPGMKNASRAPVAGGQRVGDRQRELGDGQLGGGVERHQRAARLHERA